MHPLSSHIVSVPLIKTYGGMPSRPLHDQGLEQHADLKQQHITMQSNLDLIKEEMKNYPSLSLLNYIRPFELKCGIPEDGMSMILFTMVGYEIRIVPCFETAHVSPCISTMLLMSSSENKRNHFLWEKSNGSFIHEAMEEKMIYGIHLEMGNIFPFQDFSVEIC